MSFLCRLLLAGLTFLPLMIGNARAQGRDEIIVNPRADRTWTKAAGSLLSPGRSIAVVIGISDYIGESAGGYPRLGSARNDAEKMVQFLRDTAGFDTIYVLTNERATKERIDRLMTDDIPGVVKPNDRFLFYWSGHGDQMVTADRPFGFLPVATSARKRWSSMISMEDISRWDGYLSARQTLFVLDSCLSGLAGVEKKDARDVRLEQLANSAHHLITAGTDKEVVISSDKWGGSLFTDSFIRGATSEAPQSFSVVTLFSLIGFIQDRVAIEKVNANFNKSLTPQIRSLRSGDGVFFFSPKLPTLPTPIKSGDQVAASSGVQGKGENVQQDTKEQKGEGTILIEKKQQKFAMRSKLVQSIITNSPVYSPGDVVKIKIVPASSRVKAHAIFPFMTGERAKAEARYSEAEGGVYIPYRIPDNVRSGVYEATIYLQEMTSKAEEKQTIDFEVR